MNPVAKLGIIDFVTMIYEGHPEYTVIAVKASLEDTIQTFIATSHRRETRQRFNVRDVKMIDRKVSGLKFDRKENIPLEQEQGEDENGFLAPVIPFVSIKGSDWVVVLRSLFDAKDEIFDVREEAIALSRELNTKSMILIEEDTSGAMAYQLFENGEQLESFEEACDDDFSFESKLREKPDITFNTWDEDEDFDLDDEYDSNSDPRVQFVDAFFQEQGIYLPACCPIGDPDQPRLVVMDASWGLIERVDTLYMEMELEH